MYALYIRTCTKYLNFVHVCTCVCMHDIFVYAALHCTHVYTMNVLYLAFSLPVYQSFNLAVRTPPPVPAVSRQHGRLD